MTGVQTCALPISRKHSCVLLEETGTVKGMLKTAKDFVTWGPASDETIKKLEAKGKPPYRLHPPLKGWGASIKKSFPKGALGNRGEKINELIERML